MEIKLKYGCNSHQAPAHLIVPDNSGFRVLNGTPSYINILDALGAWQLAREEFRGHNTVY
jgi:phosphoribosylaminoimidazolecarboxamide formyltransferase/IMP cyclohydrolase